MDKHTSPRTSAFEFTGNWREFAPIAFTNLLLSIVTLGVYSFWARTRERRYLWGHTRFIDDRLEWTGTGLELLIGYVLAAVVIFLPLASIQFLIQALALRGHNGAAGLLGLGIYLAVFYLIGVAMFRALRYRLSRTYWRGIRGGSDSNGLGFGFTYLWTSIAGSIVLGLLIPWSMVKLWNARWNAMSFGPHRFRSDAEWGGLFLRFLLFYLVPIIGFVAAAIWLVAFAGTFQQLATRGDLMTTFFAVGLLLYIGFFIVLGLVALFFYAAYFREVVGKLSLDGLDFGFDAHAKDWFKLFLGNIALVVCTLGIGMIFLGYRNWSFFVRHLHAYGELDVDRLTQSSTRAPGQGEGLLDAFDVGAF